jgi:DNA-binding MarR family transcriptional regulator
MTSKIDNLDWPALNISSLVGATALRLEMLADRFIFKPLDLTAASFRILAILGKCGQLSPTDLLAYLSSTKSNITQRLNFLQRCGWIETERVLQGDRRKVTVMISSAGREKLTQVQASFVKHNLQLEKFFTVTELANFKAFIVKLNQSLDSCQSKLESNLMSNK